MGAPEAEHIFGIQLRESANDGSDFSNGDTDYRVVFLGEDGLLHAKDSAGTVTGLGGSGVADQGTVTYFDFTTAAAPASPAAGKIRVYSKTGDHLAQKDSGGTETLLDSAGGGGWGNYLLIPHAVPFTQDAGTWAIFQFTAEDAYPFGGWSLACTSGSVNDAVSLPAIAMDAGTWAIDYVIRRSTNTGIITIKIAGSSVGTIDTYVSPGGHIASGSVTGISIASSGSKTLQLVMATKNASSSGYNVGIFSLNFRRTA